LLVKELVAAPEAPVQFIFMYEPIARLLLDHAAKIGEPAAVIAKARLALKQPGDSARHDDHMHVRVYCATADRRYGCVDLGPMELLAEHDADAAREPMAALPAAFAQVGERGGLAPFAGIAQRLHARGEAPSATGPGGLPGGH
jgi:penicillin-insensitive murein endopeptidase